MIKRFLNKLMMIKAVLSFLKANAIVWNQVPDIVTDVDDLEALMNEIEATHRLTSDDLSGQTDKKDAEQEKLVSTTHSLSSALAAMAVRTGNEVLLAKVDFSASHLEKQRDQEQLITAMGIATLAREHLDDLSSGGITEADVDALEEQAIRFKESLPVNRVSVSERKTANKKLTELFKQADKLIKKRLDKMMVRYETADPAFYVAYQNNRMILDYGTRYEKNDKKKEEGEVSL